MLATIPKIDRYVLSEILGPFGLGCVVYTLILFLHFLLQASKMVFARGAPVADVIKLITFYLPSMLVLVIPMAFLFATLMAVGRLSGDSEITAMRASGISLFNLYRPLLWFSLALSLISVYLMTVVIPVSNSRYSSTLYRIQTRHATQVVEPREFHTELGSWVMYVFGLAEDRSEWNGVFLAQENDPGKSEIMVAERGRLVFDEATHEQLLQLIDTESHLIDLSEPFSEAKYKLGLLDTYERVVQSAPGIDAGQRKLEKDLRSMTLTELKRERKDPTRAESVRRLALVEIHKKFSLPAASIGFGLFALPFAFGSQRRSGARSTSFALSLLVIALYYILLQQGEKAARMDNVQPWVAMWLPNLLLVGVGIYLFWRRNRDKSLLLGRADRFLRQMPLASIATRAVAKTRAWFSRLRGSAADRSWMQFPSRNDRYILRLFFTVAGLTTASMVMLTVLARFTRLIDRFQENQLSSSDIWRYLGAVALDSGYLMTPVVVLLATVLAFALLSKNNEVVAWRSTGVSLYRLALPILIATAGIAVGTFLLDEYVLPSTNQEKQRLEDRIFGRATESLRRADRQWLFGQDRFIYHYADYDQENEALNQLEVFEFNTENQLIRRLFATRATYQKEGTWLFSRGWTRSFAEGKVTDHRWFEEPHSARFPETPEYFRAEERQPAQMTFAELASHVENLERSGQPNPEYRTQLYRKIAYPAGCLAMALVALPFSFRVGREGGALYGVGLALALAIGFIVLDSIFTTLGETATLPPLVAVWAPSVLFSTLAVYLFLGVRS